MNENTIKVSIIVPVYNAQGYVAQCLGNLVNQTLQEIEIILVNDASTDETATILEQCKMQFPDKVRVIHSEENRGPGGARNLGIEQAKGAYIGFVDSDDIADVTMFEKLYQEALRTGYDVIDAGYYRQDQDFAMVHTADEQTGILNAESRSQLIVSGGYVYTKLYKRELFDDIKLRFRHNCILEDADFVTYLFGTIKTIGNLKEVVYCYRNMDNSASKITNPENYYQSIYQAMEHIYEKMSALPDYEKLREAVEYELLQMYSYGVNVCLKDYIERRVLQTESYLSKLRELKMRVVSGSYDNRYVQNKIAKADIMIMEHNDKDTKELLRLILTE